MRRRNVDTRLLFQQKLLMTEALLSPRNVRCLYHQLKSDKMQVHILAQSKVCAYPFSPLSLC